MESIICHAQQYFHLQHTRMSTQEEEASSSVCDEATMRTCGGRGGSVLSMVGTLFFSTSPLAITAEELALTVCSALCVIIVAVVIIRFLLWNNRARETLVTKPPNDLSHCKTQETTDDERKTCGFEKKSQGTTMSRPCTVSTSSQTTETLGDERDKVDDNVLAALFGHELACRAHILLVASESFLELWQWHSSWSLQQVVLLQVVQLQEDTEKKKKLVTTRSQQLASVKPMQREVANKDEEHTATKKEPEFIERSDSWSSFIDAVDDCHHRIGINHDESPPPRVPTQQQHETPAPTITKGILKRSSRVGEQQKDEHDKQQRNEKVSPSCSDGGVPILVPRSLRRSTSSSSRSPLHHSHDQTSHNDEVFRSREVDAAEGESIVIENGFCGAFSSLSSSQPASSASPPVLTPFNMRSRRQQNAPSPSPPLQQQHMPSSVDSVDDEEIAARKRGKKTTTDNNNDDECDEIIAMALQCAVSSLLEVVEVSPATQCQEGNPSLVGSHQRQEQQGDALSTLCVGDLLVDINGSAFTGKDELADVLASLLLSHRTKEEEEGGGGGSGQHHHRFRSVVLVNVLRQDGESLSLKTIEVPI